MLKTITKHKHKIALYSLVISSILQFDILWERPHTTLLFTISILSLLFFKEIIRSISISEAFLTISLIIIISINSSILYGAVFISSRLALYLIVKSLKRIERNDLERFLFFSYCLIVSYLLFETIIRFAWPTYNIGSPHHLESIITNLNLPFFKRNFYTYKYSSFIGHDSNSTAVYNLCFFSLALYLSFFKNFKLKKFIFPLYFLCFLTFSRSAIITESLLLIAYLISRTSKNIKITIAIIIALLFIPASHYISINKSFNYRLTSIKILMQKLPKESLKTILIGKGIKKGSKHYTFKKGSFAHSFLPIIFGQIGILGFTIYSTILLIFLFLYGSRILFYIGPYFINGISLGDPWLFTFLFLLYFLSYIEKNYTYSTIRKNDTSQPST